MGKAKQEKKTKRSNQASASNAASNRQGQAENRTKQTSGEQ